MTGRPFFIAAAAVCAVVPAALVTARHRDPTVVVVQQSVAPVSPLPGTRRGAPRIPSPPELTNAAPAEAAATTPTFTRPCPSAYRTSREGCVQACFPAASVTRARTYPSVPLS